MKKNYKNLTETVNYFSSLLYYNNRGQAGLITCSESFSLSLVPQAFSKTRQTWNNLMKNINPVRGFSRVCDIIKNTSNHLHSLFRLLYYNNRGQCGLIPVAESQPSSNPPRFLLRHIGNQIMKNINPVRGFSRVCDILTSVKTYLNGFPCSIPSMMRRAV